MVQGRGHPLIRVSHAKTLEFTGEPDVSARATCVAGVAAALDPQALALLRGRVRLTVAAAGHEVSGEAVINPAHEVRDRLVIRRSYHADPDTLAVGSTLVAEDLSPALAATLTDTGTVVTLTVAEAEPPAPLVLICPDAQRAPAGRLGVLWQHADAAVDLAIARGRARESALLALGRGGTVAVTLPEWPGAIARAASEWLAAAAGRGARFAAPGSGAELAETMLAAGLPVAPALWLGRVDGPAARRPEIAGLLRSAPVPAVLIAPPGEAAGVLDLVAAAAHERRVAVPRGELDVGSAMGWTTAAGAAAQVRQCRAATDVVVVLGADPAVGGWVDLVAVASALADAGVAPRTVSDALAQFGLSRRRLYGL